MNTSTIVTITANVILIITTIVTLKDASTIGSFDFEVVSGQLSNRDAGQSIAYAVLLSIHLLLIIHISIFGNMLSV
jgi:hypothetical protein